MSNQALIKPTLGVIGFLCVMLGLFLPFMHTDLDTVSGPITSMILWSVGFGLMYEAGETEEVAEVAHLLIDQPAPHPQPLSTPVEVNDNL